MRTHSYPPPPCTHTQVQPFDEELRQQAAREAAQLPKASDTTAPTLDPVTEIGTQHVHAQHPQHAHQPAKGPAAELKELEAVALGTVQTLTSKAMAMAREIQGVHSDIAAMLSSTEVGTGLLSVMW